MAKESFPFYLSYKEMITHNVHIVRDSENNIESQIKTIDEFLEEEYKEYLFNKKELSLHYPRHKIKSVNKDLIIEPQGFIGDIWRLRNKK